MYLTGRTCHALDRVLGIVCVSPGRYATLRACFRRDRTVRKHDPDALQILRRVDADRIELGFEGFDPYAVLERAQLFEGLGPLHVAVGGKRREPHQALAPVDVQADMPPRRARLGNPGARSGIGAREKYSAKSSRSTTTFVTFGFVAIRLVVDPPSQRAHHQAGVARERRDGLVDHRRLDERLVPLHVDDHVARQRRRDLRDAIGPALMRRRRHARVARRTPITGCDECARRR